MIPWIWKIMESSDSLGQAESHFRCEEKSVKKNDNKRLPVVIFYNKQPFYSWILTEIQAQLVCTTAIVYNIHG